MPDDRVGGALYIVLLDLLGLEGRLPRLCIAQGPVRVALTLTARLSGKVRPCAHQPYPRAQHVSAYR